MTKEYEMLRIKARMFAEVYEYEYFEYGGYFNFYNSPLFSSFEFHVDPETFTGEPIFILKNAFESR